jgi:serine/threonine-protein kinase RsbW
MDKPQISDNVITIPSDAVFLAAVDDFVYEMFGKSGVAKSMIADFAISVSEIVNNSITHGAKGDRSKPVSVKIDIADNEACISIKDQGEGFDPHSLPDPLATENLLKQVGRGIFIVKSLMDSVDFNITGSGSEVILKKKLNS